jgi:crotonobetainyl-CoA:carnitine CoA-transferase CaiB-like acyl-CoA transferase
MMTSRVSRKKALSKSNLALEGLRVIDLSQVYAGPYATKLLADMGAEVIRIECAARSARGGALPRMQPGGAFGASFPDGDTGERSYNRYAYYNEVNRNKLAITLDLSKPRGIDVFKRLVRISDVVVENFTPRVMQNFGLDYPVLRELNPRIMMISISGFGQDGPCRDCVAYGEGIEAMAGLSYLTSYTDGTPLKPGVAYADAVSGLHAAFAILAALRHRRTTGKGQYIDLSMREALTPLLGAAIMDYAMNRRVARPAGNRHPKMAPHGCYRTKGDDRWIAIAVSSDEEWRALCRVMSDPTWSKKAKFATMADRLKNQNELDHRLEEWTIEFDHIDLMEALQEAGVKAGAVLDTAELSNDPHLNQRGFFEELSHPEAGTHRYPGASWRMSRTPGKLRLPAPCFGQHNRYVFGELLGMSDEDIMRLKGAGVTAEEPLPYEEI